MIIYGGEKVFAAGADINEMAEVSYAGMAPGRSRSPGAFDAVARIPKPVVAAITGYALGGGCELALACDFRVAGDDAQLGQPEILLGIIPGAGGTQRLARLVGPARAKDLIFSGRMVDAAEALRIGLVDRVVPDDAVYQTAVELVQPYVAGPVAGAARGQAGHRPRARRATWPPAWTSSRCCSPGCSAPTTSEVGCAASWRHGPGKATFTGR